MKYSILEIEKKSGKSGNSYFSALFKTQDEEGAEIKATSFDLDNVKIGDVIEGDIIKNGNFNNFKIKKEEVKKGVGAFSGVKVAQERKQEMIEKSQDRKDDSIRNSSTFRDATILTQVWASKQTAFLTTEEIEKKWIEFRNWLFSHYEVEITDTKPF